MVLQLLCIECNQYNSNLVIGAPNKFKGIFSARGNGFLGLFGLAQIMKYCWYEALKHVRTIKVLDMTQIPVYDNNNYASKA
jgi:hypothetical protein